MREDQDNNIKKKETAFRGMPVGALYSAGAVISRAVTSVSNAFFPYCSENHNSSFEFRGFIHDQSAGDAAHIKMGYHRASFNGCGWIAAYNAGIIAGIPIQPQEIIKYLEKNGGILLNGLLGSNPLIIRDFFRRTGADARAYFLPRRVDGIIKGADTCVLMYAHSRGMHFVAVCHNKGEFLIFNDCTGQSEPIHVASVDSRLKDGRHKHHPVALITICKQTELNLDFLKAK